MGYFYKSPCGLSGRLTYEGDAKKAEAALVKAKRDYDVVVLTREYAEKLPGYVSAKQREGLKRFLAKHNVSLEG